MKCSMCDKDVPDYEPEICCSSPDCGCRGLPIYPCICSSACWDKMLDLGNPADGGLKDDLGNLITEQD